MKTLLKGSLLLVAALLLAACASTPPNPAVGIWDINMETPVGAMVVTLDIQPDLSGTMSSGDLGSVTLNGVAVEGNALNFEATVDAQGQTVALRFAGTIDGDNLAGNFDTDFGAIPVAGVRR
ncbi:MAG: hypothetical protein V4751_14415 [Pseudomonadota bacterium]